MDFLKQAPGMCGCGTLDIDSDNDGLPIAWKCAPAIR